ncbi:hypothetical protein ACLOJK_016655 [Asimina triloba]
MPANSTVGAKGRSERGDGQQNCKSIFSPALRDKEKAMAGRLLLSRLFASSRTSPSKIKGLISLLSPTCREYNLTLDRHSNISTAKRWIHARAWLTTKEHEDYDNRKTGSNNPEAVPDSIEVVGLNDKDGTVKYAAVSYLKTSTRHDLAMIFTCKVCETRSVKTVCRESYDKGVVVVRCGGCNNLHLIADHLGWFGEPGSIEELLAARGEEVKKGCMTRVELAWQRLPWTKSDTSLHAKFPRGGGGYGYNV